MPLTPPRALRARPSPCSGRVKTILPRSRDAPSHPSFASRFKKALRASLERREAERRQAHHWFPPRRRKISLPAYAARAIFAPCPALARDLRGGALAFRRPTAACAEGLTSTRLRAALPGITGSKREDPLRHQCSQHLAVRSRAGRSMPRTARTHGVSPRFREPPPLRLGVPSRRRPRRAGFQFGGECNDNGDGCQELSR